ncbi:MAG: DUF349 domain-containing protein [Pseudomonadota bacterium]|nr:DUF349 domain-containing protein [Pseudomonadota bacterium]
MFDFLFKRAAKKNAATVTSTPAAPVAADPRQSAREHAASLRDNESASVDFLLACEFADARLIAAQAVQSELALRRVFDAMRNTDRRVARLMQARLDVLTSQAQLARATAACTAEAQQLLVEPRLLPNQVSELDRRWAALQPVPESMQNAFDPLRKQLGARLAAQAALQRMLIDAASELDALRADAHSLDLAVLTERFAALESNIAFCRTSAELPTVPRQLLQQCEQAAAALQDRLVVLQRQQQARASRVDLLEQWEAAAPDSLDATDLQRQWRDQAELPFADNALDDRLAELLRRVREAQPAPLAIKPKHPISEQVAAVDQRALHERFTQTLTVLTEALTEGALQAATEADRQLRALATVSLSADQTSALATARAELARLQGWARWGGNISREELQKAAEALPQQSLAVAELAKRVGSLRERWKSLDRSAGPAPKELWQGFDNACTAAYAPVAAHFAELSIARQANAEQLLQLIGKVNVEANTVAQQATPDWKAVALFCQRCRQEMARVGPIERRAKKRLQADFDTAVARLETPLAAVQAGQVVERERLIAEAQALDPAARGALDALKSLQERWQEQARVMPLERQLEQTLWQRFRSACDGVFAQRKLAAAVADAQRQMNLEVRQALCARLESALDQHDADGAAVLAEIARQWQQAGAVARAQEEAINTRYRKACDAVTARLDAERAAKGASLRQAVLQRLALCQRAEELLLTSESVAVRDLLQKQWKEAGVGQSAIDQTLQRRFARAIAACQGHDAMGETDGAPAVAASVGSGDYRASLQRNTALLAREVLRLEIVLSLPSPPADAQERLQLQVDVLRATLAAGQRPVSHAAQLQALLDIAAVTDAALSARVARVAEQLLH